MIGPAGTFAAPKENEFLDPELVRESIEGAFHDYPLKEPKSSICPQCGLPRLHKFSESPEIY